MALDVTQTILDLGLPDQAIQADELPWVPQGDRVWFKPLRFDLASGWWVNLLKVTGQGRVNRHRHAGGQVLGYVLQGSWRYLEREWVARPGTFVYEPPGDIHTLVVDGAEEMHTLFLLEGASSTSTTRTTLSPRTMLSPSWSATWRTASWWASSRKICGSDLPRPAHRRMGKRA